MKRLLRIATLALPLTILAAAPAYADVKTRDKTTVKFEGMLGRMFNLFGGKAAKEGVEAKTAVKGSRKATINDSTGHIVDLSEEKVYDLDMRKKTYTVTTFEELRRRMRESEDKAKEQASKEEPSRPQEPQQQQTPSKEYEVDFDVKDTGQKKQIAGYDTHEAIITVTVREKGKTLDEGGGMVMTSDTWLGPVIPEMKELADFDLRYAKQLAGPEAVAQMQQLAAALGAFPMMKNAMGKMQQEGSKVHGTALETTTVFESVKSKEQLAEMQQQQSSSGGGGLSGMLARKIAKKEEPKARSTIVTIHNEFLEVSKSVDPSDIALPADFKEKK
jgi:hypothetical protein